MRSQCLFLLNRHCPAWDRMCTTLIQDCFFLDSQSLHSSTSSPLGNFLFRETNSRHWPLYKKRLHNSLFFQNSQSIPNMFLKLIFYCLLCYRYWPNWLLLLPSLQNRFLLFWFYKHWDNWVLNFGNLLFWNKQHPHRYTLGQSKWNHPILSIPPLPFFHNAKQNLWKRWNNTKLNPNKWLRFFWHRDWF